MLYILIVVLGGILSYFLPWWVVAPLIFGLSWWKAPSAGNAAKIGIAALVTLWLGYAMFLNLSSEINLMDKVGAIFGGESGPLSKVPKTALIFTVMTIIVTALGGLAGSAGVMAREFFKK
jgi:uncharacterized membrane protein